MALACKEEALIQKPLDIQKGFYLYRSAFIIGIALVCKEGALVQKPLDIQKELSTYRMAFIYTEGPLNIKKGADLFTKEGSFLYIHRRALIYNEDACV
jgi:hypothetical protein